MLLALIDHSRHWWLLQDSTRKWPLMQICYRHADGPLNLLVDSTGNQFLGDGDWQARKHGVEGRSQWHKVPSARPCDDPG